jgi:hypothetical protein
VEQADLGLNYLFGDWVPISELLTNSEQGGWGTVASIGSRHYIVAVLRSTIWTSPFEQHKNFIDGIRALPNFSHRLNFTSSSSEFHAFTTVNYRVHLVRGVKEGAVCWLPGQRTNICEEFEMWPAAACRRGRRRQLSCLYLNYTFFHLWTSKFS